ncbi:hypothetical protein BTA51_05950 [Hahella sp. CCB-MM4]|uniref:DUF1499 domain-containing protein n=1 Tax=Hahella sp. (strain CCB-MM4) TaxID=1926491 RepID=UPI000B9BE5B9|nr:DUF1499 domain-containing protein [Hahella sp. CCB-MM4]OZG74540.1 hypothetical protein BTA51_05950 [Hahella sp. CCB-MM4]
MERPGTTGNTLLYITIGSYAVIALSIVLIREHILYFRIGFVLLLLGALVSVITSVMSLRRLLNGRCRTNGSTGLNGLNLILGIGPFAVLLTKIIAASQYPVMHDITTDTTNPPPLSAALLLRDATDHTTTYNPALIDMQSQSYPGIKPLISPLPATALARNIRHYMQEHGWEIVSSDDDNHLIEAVVTTPLFKFKDDIVVRLTPEDNSTRVDVRSASRVGKSDLGTNAARIEALLSSLH